MVRRRHAAVPSRGPGHPAEGWRGERGSAVAESTMVMALLVLLFATLLQAGIVVHTRNVLIDAASAGARHGALADRTPEEGAARTREVIAASVPGQSGATVTARATSMDGVPVVTVTVESSLPGLGFLPGPVPVSVRGHAYRY